MFTEMSTRKAMTVQELQDIIETDWDEVVDVIVLPPTSVDALSDEEFLDDDIIPMNDSVIFYYYYCMNLCFNN